MFSNYILTAWRNILRFKGYSMINIFGLALGLALVMLIALYIDLEFSFDRFHQNYDRIHRVEVNYDNKGRCLAFSHTPLGPELANTYPEIESYTRFLNMGNPVFLYHSEEKRNYETNGWWADSLFFTVFTYRFIQGDAEHALQEPNSIVLSEKMANKYFGSENPLGKSVRFENTFDCKVTAVVQDCPPNSHIQYEFFISYDSYRAIAGDDYLDNWHRLANFTYVVLSEKADLRAINIKIRNILQPHLPPEVEMPVYLKPLSQIHFAVPVLGSIGPAGDKERIRFLIMIGAAIIFLGCINFMNLATARSARRSREVGIRKVAGAHRLHLIHQFLGESIFMALLALMVAFILAQLFLPVFGDLLGRQLSWTAGHLFVLIPGYFIIAIIIGIIAGTYPAFYLSSFQPGTILKGAAAIGSRSVLRKALVVFQFIVSITLILSSWMIYRQIHYMKSGDLGYHSEQILLTTFRRMDAATISKYETFMNELLQQNGIVDACVSRDVPSFNSSSTLILNWEGSTPDDKMYVNINLIDESFLRTYGITLQQGRNFDRVAREDTTRYCLINETAAKRLNWDVPVGKRLAGDLYVLGVVADFHYASLRYGIEPMVLFPLPRSPHHSRARYILSLKLAAQDIDQTIKMIKSTYEKIFPNDIFEYHFFDEMYDRMYRNEARTARTITYFALLAVCISCLGLYGLASFMAEQRTKEIGIRKVMGSSIAAVVLLLVKEYSKWVVIATIIAWPIGYFIM
ncbi:ABC transporter permease, partial [candidate division KSB1 bacterium]|nr:ABC transporter permease [candidate division KSB1 bacterium]